MPNSSSASSKLSSFSGLMSSSGKIAVHLVVSQVALLFSLGDDDL